MSVFSVCPPSLFESLPNHNRPCTPALFLRYQQWENALRKLSSPLEGCALRLFISNVRYSNFVEVFGEDLREACYYDKFAYELADVLKKAGFIVSCDVDKQFMNFGPDECDVIISVCTPLYKQRSSVSGSRLCAEVENIKRIVSDYDSKVLYIPLLVHAYDANFPSEHLLIGQDNRQINSSPSVDLRDPGIFLSNIWMILSQLGVAFAIKQRSIAEEHEEDTDERRDNLTASYQEKFEEYVGLLEELLGYDDYFDCRNNLSYPSTRKSQLVKDLNSLRVHTTVTPDINPEKLLYLLKQEIQLHGDLFSISLNRDVAVFLGDTGVGKSTLINYLAGKELRPVGINDYELVVDDPSSMKIGHGWDSETLYPQYIVVNGIVYFDLPGFADSSGSVQELVNSAFIHRIIMSARSVRFIFVLSWNEMESKRGESMKKLLQSVARAFPGQQNIIRNSSMLMITKSDCAYNDLALVQSHIQRRLSGTHKSQTLLREQISIWQERGAMNHVPKPRVENISQKPHIRQGLIQSIRNVCGASNSQVQDFQLSKFYSSTVTTSLQNMFLYVIEKEIGNIYLTLQKRIEQLILPTFNYNYLGLSASGMCKKIFLFVDILSSFDERQRAILSDIQLYLSPKHFQSVVWPDVDRKFSSQREIQLLIGVFGETYKNAKALFQRDQLSRIKLLPEILNMKIAPLQLEREKFKICQIAAFTALLAENCEDFGASIRKKMDSSCAHSNQSEFDSLQAEIATYSGGSHHYSSRSVSKGNPDFATINKFSGALSTSANELGEIGKEIDGYLNPSHWSRFWSGVDHQCQLDEAQRRLINTYHVLYSETKKECERAQKACLKKLSEELQNKRNVISSKIEKLNQAMQRVCENYLNDQIVPKFNNIVSQIHALKLPTYPSTASGRQNVDSITESTDQEFEKYKKDVNLFISQLKQYQTTFLTNFERNNAGNMELNRFLKAHDELYKRTVKKLQSDFDQTLASIQTQTQNKIENCEKQRQAWEKEVARVKYEYDHRNTFVLTVTDDRVTKDKAGYRFVEYGFTCTFGVGQQQRTWIVWKRYSLCLKLHNQLLNDVRFPSPMKGVSFPPSYWLTFGRFSKALISRRRIELGNWWKKVLANKACTDFSEGHCSNHLKNFLDVKANVRWLK